MYTQNTPVHVKLWHKDFWLLSTAGMLLTAVMYLQFSLLPVWISVQAGFSAFSTALALSVPVVGMFSVGCFCSYWVQRYRRSRVCVVAMLVMALCFCFMYYVARNLMMWQYAFYLLISLRIVQGAAFGVAYTVLSGTLIIDTCESFKRTEANHSSAWFARLSLSLGPAAGIVLMLFFRPYVIMLISSLLCILSVVCVQSVDFPFKAPADGLRKMSLDRFFLPQGKWLFFNLALITMVVGLLLSVGNTLEFYCMLMLGFVLALFAQRFVFVNADLKSEVTSGLIMMIVAFLLDFSDRTNAIVYISPTLSGCAVGLIGARFLLFFIKLRGHCQRGTSLSTFFLSWEMGLALGLFLGYSLFSDDRCGLIVTALVLAALALILYLAFTHNWYIKNKDR